MDGIFLSADGVNLRSVDLTNPVVWTIVVGGLVFYFEYKKRDKSFLRAAITALLAGGFIFLGLTNPGRLGDWLEIGWGWAWSFIQFVVEQIKNLWSQFGPS